MTKLRIIAAAALLLCTATACSDPRGPAPDEAAPTQSAAPAEPSTGSSTAATGAAVPGDPCTGEDIKVDATLMKAGIALLAITNTSTTACRISGWPKLTLLAADNSALTVPVREVPQPGPATPSDLDPGESAFAGVKWTNCDKAAAGCAVVTTLTVAPEGGGSPVVAKITGVEGGSQTVPELPLSALEVGTIQPSSQGVIAW
ncbi:DUF4232 domain-containing protein [Catenuloplanes japonicus]|uniref:DUF4232 domain-containing protein n=1 Tax=Catenuloplanes japonicus TaxID=33876 RepID=UPI00068E3663|nr:DUF4232 domain-containing protein [Catenuloplanes japonicus]